jgi:hypothetical protein
VFARVCLLDCPLVRLRHLLPASRFTCKYYHLDHVIFSIRDVNVTVQVGSNVHGKMQAATSCDENKLEVGKHCRISIPREGKEPPAWLEFCCTCRRPYPSSRNCVFYLGPCLRGDFGRLLLPRGSRVKTYPRILTITTWLSTRLLREVFKTRYASRTGGRGRGHGRVRIPQMRRCPHLPIATCTSHIALVRAGVCGNEQWAYRCARRPAFAYASAATASTSNAGATCNGGSARHHCCITTVVSECTARSSGRWPRVPKCATCPVLKKKSRHCLTHSMTNPCHDPFLSHSGEGLTSEDDHRVHLSPCVPGVKVAACSASHLQSRPDVGDAAPRAEVGLSRWQMLPRSCRRLLRTTLRSKSEEQLRRRMAVETMGADCGFPTMRADMTPDGMERDVVSAPYWQRSLL